MTKLSIKVKKLPVAFDTWWGEICVDYPFSQLEIVRGEVAVCRVMMPLKDLSNIGDLKYGKIIRNGIGLFVEKTFVPKYIPEEDKVVIV